MTATNGVPASPIEVDGKSFALNGAHMSYRLHVDEQTQDLFHAHFGGPATESEVFDHDHGKFWHGWTNRINWKRREFPDLGRGDFRLPAYQIRSAAGHTISALKYESHEVLKGEKPKNKEGLPGLFGGEDDVSTLIVKLKDEISGLRAELSYSVFPKYDAIARSVRVINDGTEPCTVERLSSMSIDFAEEELDIIELRGDWARECQRTKRKVDYGTQGFGTTTGYSSHHHNPFLCLATPETTETHGDAWGFSLIWTGSFNAEVEKNSQDLTRATIGLHPAQLSWKLAPGESVASPECVAVYAADGIGGMSRRFHSLFRKHLVKSKFSEQPRPVLLNTWEGVYFTFEAEKMYQMAEATSALGIRLMVMDDGWFGGEKYPRESDKLGLGDWEPVPKRFPDGLPALVDRITKLDVKGKDEKLRFGVWVEPEMLNAKSVLYETHPDWVMHAGDYPRSENRNQLVLNVGLKEVQDFIIDTLTKLLESADITYIKWDNNRGMHEMDSPNASYEYMLGLYRVLDTLTTKFPDVLWEGCASGGARFDPGMLQYFPQSWTSDDTDAYERLAIQFGASLVYPAASMGAHVSAVPNHVTHRVTPLEFRAHVAMMGGSFGFELDPTELSEEEKAKVPGIIALAEKVNPIVVSGDMYRLRLPEDGNWPAMMFISADEATAVLFTFQKHANVNRGFPNVKLQGLDPKAKYKVGEDGPVASGATLMNVGLQYTYKGDYGSKVTILEKQ
ncbi:putative alpha-galactosidase C [Sarocladium strictum]